MKSIQVQLDKWIICMDANPKHCNCIHWHLLISDWHCFSKVQFVKHEVYQVISEKPVDLNSKEQAVGTNIIQSYIYIIYHLYVHTHHPLTDAAVLCKKNKKTTPSCSGWFNAQYPFLSAQSVTPAPKTKLHKLSPHHFTSHWTTTDKTRWNMRQSGLP